MAGEDRSTPHPLIESLRAEPWAHDFFQVVRRLEALHRGRAPLGVTQRLADDPIRFGQDPSLAFAPSTLGAFRESDGRPPRLFVNFLGLMGPNGPLPLHVTDYARDRVVNAHDATFGRFLDVFHHRVISLFYRAWAAAQKTVSHERSEADRFAVFVGSLFGMGMAPLTDRDAVPDSGKRYHAGHLSAQTRHSAGLRALLEDYFGVKTEIREFMGQWLVLPDDSRCFLGRGGGKTTGRLGSTTIVGARMWDCQQKFRIRFGPMKLAQYERLLPGGPSQKRLAAWIANYLGYEYLWEVQLVLLADEVPTVRLGRVGKLGWSTWIKTGPLNRNPDDLILQPHLN